MASSEDDSCKTPTNQVLGQEDEELSKLLDSSLNDFGKSTTNPLTVEEINEMNSMNEDLDPDLARKAAADFRLMIQQLAEMQKVVMHQLESENGGPNVSSQGSEDTVTSQEGTSGTAGGPDEDIQFAQTFIKNMQFIAEKAQKVQEAKTDDEFASAMKQLSDDETYESEFMPFMQGLMGGLLSKEMLQAPMNEMCEKYPAWIEENKSKLDAATLERYEKQLELMKQVASEYDAESQDETDLEKSQRFERIVVSMQKMQSYGYPPEELIGQMPNGWTLDQSTGLPAASDPEKAAEACCIM